MSLVALTHHAETRANQRGVPHHLLDALLLNADIDAPIGGSCRLLRVSKQRLRDRAVRRALGSEADRLVNLALIWSDDAGAVITVLHHHRGHSGRRYRSTH
jgi:hypothetical protein